ncbi:Uncharacterized protein dnm_067900 [Desulfonema magnum]|uniref:Uncharacterized protein n=1 Tax=Desulfonema magnum TaxID=45655 RepID=A0A975BT38_9BACT|nr:Uncharacterized protein dnm_067900 [Desulfonema magnum]
MSYFYKLSVVSFQLSAFSCQLSPNFFVFTYFFRFPSALT